MAIEIKDEQLFGKVIANALVAVETSEKITSGNRYRWIAAINKGVAKLGDLSYQMEWMNEEKHLLIWSDSLKIYEANGTCQCKAFELRQPCWHRALAKLIKHYLAAESKPPQTSGAAAGIGSYNSAPYLKPSSDAKPTSIGNVRI